MSQSDYTPASESDEVIGIYAPRCPDCGWQAVDRPYTEADRDEQRALARADVVGHIAECDVRNPPATDPDQERIEEVRRG